MLLIQASPSPPEVANAASQLRKNPGKFMHQGYRLPPLGSLGQVGGQVTGIIIDGPLERCALGLDMWRIG